MSVFTKEEDESSYGTTLWEEALEPFDFGVDKHIVKLESTVIDKARVEKELKSITTYKATVPDNVHPRVLKESAEEISVPITLLFN